MMYSSAHADHFFTPRRHEPARPGHGGSDAFQNPDDPTRRPELSDSLNLTRSNVSNHLTCLRDCGIVVAEPEGRKTRYEIADPHLAAALDALVNAKLAVDENAPCIDPECSVPGCGEKGADA